MAKKGSGIGIAFLKMMVTYEGQSCVTWPFFRNWDGYPVVSIERKTRKAARVMCEIAHGPPPTPEHEAAHSCGNGNKGCVNPNHLSWKTPSENGQDRTLHGTGLTNKAGCRSPLSPETFAEIKAAIGSAPVLHLARRFNTSRRTIERIRSGIVPKFLSTKPENVKRRKFQP
jgi:hypothetical protein